MPTDGFSYKADAVRGVLSRSGSRVLLIGCGTHVAGSRLPDVPAVAGTVADLARVLRDCCDVDQSQITVLADPLDPLEFGSVLTDVAGQATDAVLVYYTGHGLIGPDQQLYLATQATTDLGIGIPGQQALAYPSLLPVIQGAPARLAIIVLDCCFAGRAYAGRSAAWDVAFDATRRHGIYLMTAAGYDERAWAPEGERHTAFTGELIRLLEKGDPAGPPWLTLDDVYHALDRVLLGKGWPRPRRQAADTSGDQLIVVNHAYRAPQAPRLPRPAPARVGDSSPYRGLEPYGPQHARYFFGRRSLTTQLSEQVMAWDGTMTVVTGPSGSGKSSLIRAGLIAAVEEGRVDSVARTCMLLTPGPEPSRRLSGGLRAAHEPGTASFILIVDQFEELFTGNVPEGERQGFVRALAETARQTPVIIGVRADFFGHCARYPELVAALSQSVVVGPMGEADLREVIEGPAREVGLSLQEGLADRLLRDLGAANGAEAAGALPLLSHALLATWQHREGDTLTLDSYHATGGIDQAVAQSAETTLQSLPANYRETVRWLLMRMIRIGDGTDDTRRSVPLGELLPQHDRPRAAVIRAVLDAFISARLVTAEGDTVTITHEALIRAWPQLRAWINEDRAGLLLRQQLTDSAAAWHREGRDPSALYRGQRLAAAREWAAGPGRRSELGNQAREFLELSEAQEAATELAARHRGRQRRILALALAVLLIVAALAGGVAFQQDRAAARSARVATAGRLINLAGALRASRPRTSLALGVAAMAEDPSSDARASLMETLTQSQYLGTLTDSASVNTVAFSPRDGLLASGNGNGSVIIWKPSAHRRVARFKPTRESVGSVSFSPDGTILAVASANYSVATVTLWSMADPRHPRLMGRIAPGSQTSVSTPIVEFSPAAPILVTSDGDLSASVWNITDPRHPRKTGGLTSPTGPVYAMAIRPDGKQLAVGSDDSTTTLYRISPAGAVQQQGRVVYSDGPSTGIYAVGYSPNGRTLATASGPAVRLWNITDPHHSTVHATFNDHSSTVQALAFSSQGALVTVGQDDVAYDYTPSNSGSPEFQTAALRGHKGTINSVAFSPDGQMLATGDLDHTIDLWRTRSLALPQVTAVSSAHRGYTSAAYSANGARLIATGADFTLELWQSHGNVYPVQPATVTVPTSQSNQSSIAALGEDGVTAASFSPNGQIVATSSFAQTGGFGGLAMLWRVTPVGRLVHLTTLGGKVAFNTVAISPNGRLLAAGGTAGAPGGTRGVVVLFEINNPARPHLLATLRVPAWSVNSVAFAPDGNFLATAGDAAGPATGTIWNISKPTVPRLMAKLSSASTNAYDVAFSHSGHSLAISADDGSATLWNVTDPAHPQQAGILAGNLGPVMSVAFSPDGRTVVTAGDDKTAILWDITDPGNPVQLATISGDAGAVYAVFNPAGTMVTTASMDGSVAWWDTANITAVESDPVTEACEILGPKLRSADWSPYVGADIGRNLCK